MTIPETTHDLAVIVVSTNEGSWLKKCLPTISAHAGDLDLDVVVVDNASTDDTAQVVANAPGVRLVAAANHGFSHGNNRGLMTVSARYVLFLNPDTEIVEGTLQEMVQRMDESPEVGLAGCRQYLPSGELFWTMRRFPNAMRQFAEAFFSERWRGHPEWAGERIIDAKRYATEFDADWTSGSFMLTRMEAIEGAGFLDERFFLYSEETDLALRIRKHGWSVRHLPQMAIIHHAGKAGWSERGEAQGSYARLLYAKKHFSPLHATAYRVAMITRYALRVAVWAPRDSGARRAFARALLIALGADRTAPYQAVPPTAVRERAGSAQ